MATYNGASFLAEQLDTILHQLTESDELIAVDDASTDDTRRLLRLYADRDSRVRLLFHSTNRGHVQTFESAIRLARNEFILFADQDDLWEPNHVAVLRDGLIHADVAAANLTRFGYQTGPLPRPFKDSDNSHYLGNLIGILIGRRPYYGCAMGMRASLTRLLLPIPSWASSHDLWLAIVGNLTNSIHHSPVVATRRREHPHNLSASRRRRSLVQQLSTRSKLVAMMLVAYHRLRSR